MFLVLGLPQCDYCRHAKAILDSKNLPYIYVDVTAMCGPNWKPAFNKAFPSQRAFPVIFDADNSVCQKADISLDDLSNHMLIGNYFDLEDQLESMVPDAPVLTDEY
jgi:glutaredoxin